MSQSISHYHENKRLVGLGVDHRIEHLSDHFLDVVGLHILLGELLLFLLSLRGHYYYSNQSAQLGEFAEISESEECPLVSALYTESLSRLDAQHGQQLSMSLRLTVVFSP